MFRFHLRFKCSMAGALVVPALLWLPNQPAGAQAIEEIVVTSRRVEESLQDIPLSVVAFTGEDLALRGLERGEDLMNAVPNVVIGGSGLTTSSSAITIRGMPNVGVYLDGVAQNTIGLLQSSLIELERLEILRGPQGTLFGRNSNGGAIQLITRRPGSDFGARVRTEIGEYNRMDLSASVDVPLTDTLLSKFTIGSFTQDGQVCSLTIPACYGGKNDELFRADFLWTPNAVFDLRLALDSQKTESSDRKAVVFTNPNHVRIAALNIAAQNPAFRSDEFLPITEYSQRTHEAGFPGGEVGEWQTKGDGPEDGISTDYEALTLTMNWEINDNISLESISAWWRKDGHNYRDLRGAEVIEGVEDNQFTRDEAWSQEFHLTGSAFSDRVTYLGGLWYQDSEDWGINYRWPVPWARVPDGPNPEPPLMDGPVNNCRPDLIVAVRSYVRDSANWDVGFTDYANVPGLPAQLAEWVPTSGMPPNGPACNADPSRDDAKDYALFGEVGIALTDQLNLGLGVRWSDRESLDYSYSRQGVPGTAVRPGVPGPIVGELWAANITSITKEPDASVWFTPKVSLDYRWTDDVMIYGSYAEGFTAGEVVISAQGGVIERDPETVETIEFGIHSDWLDGTLRFNGSIFFTDWVNLRTSVNPPDPGNPGQFLLAAVTVTGGNGEASGLDAEVIWRPDENWYLTAAVGFLDTKYKELIPGVPVVEGQQFPFAPDYSYNVAAQYDWNLSSGAVVSLRGDYRYMDDYVMHARQSAQFPQEGFGISSARLTYQPASQEWSAYVYGSNLADKRYWNSGFIGATGGLFLAQLGPRQEIGAGLSFNFD